MVKIWTIVSMRVCVDVCDLLSLSQSNTKLDSGPLMQVQTHKQRSDFQIFKETAAPKCNSTWFIDWLGIDDLERQRRLSP